MTDRLKDLSPEFLSEVSRILKELTNFGPKDIFMPGIGWVLLDGKATEQTPEFLKLLKEKGMLNE